MIIVSGWLRVDPTEREAYLQGCRVVMEAGRAAEGCVDFHLSADALEPDRINVFEQWESADAVEAFRGEGPTGEQSAAIREMSVSQHVVASSTRL